MTRVTCTNSREDNLRGSKNGRGVTSQHTLEHDTEETLPSKLKESILAARTLRPLIWIGMQRLDWRIENVKVDRHLGAGPHYRCLIYRDNLSFPILMSGYFSCWIFTIYFWLSFAQFSRGSIIMKMWRLSSVSNQSWPSDSQSCRQRFLWIRTTNLH